MGALWSCVVAKLASGGALLEVEAQGNSVECCTCEERSTASDSPKRAEPQVAKENTDVTPNTDVTAIPSDLQTPRTIPPAELFQAASEVTVVKINV